MNTTVYIIQGTLEGIVGIVVGCPDQESEDVKIAKTNNKIEDEDEIILSVLLETTTYKLIPISWLRKCQMQIEPTENFENVQIEK